MKKVAILMTVYNRREMTLECLRRCYAEIDALKAEGKYQFAVYLTDEGSSDHISEAVPEEFPEVHIIRKNRRLFWNQGMIAAWQEAEKNDFDFYIWLNCDTIIEHGAFAALLENSSYLKHRAIVVGTTAGSNGSLNYGGRTKKGSLIKPDPEIPVPCDIFNGNLVLVSKSVYEILGTLDPHYSNSFGDFDYGIRALNAGVVSVVAPGVLATCDNNPGIPKWRDASYPLKERYAAVCSPKGRPFSEQFLYDTRRRNFLYALGHFVTLNLRILFPQRKAL